MAEMLIVVAVIMVLSGVGFIAVQAHQKSMSQLEADAIAKEIFIAAQNHLTMAESQGYMGDTVNFGTDATTERAGTGETEGGTADTSGSQQPVYRFDVPGSSFDSSSVLGLMLPFGSIDETIRTNGNYVIYYQANPARVLDVFYGAKNGRYAANPVGGSYSTLLDTSKNHSDKVVLGWYGGAETQESGVQLNAPVITVENAERLTVTVDASKVNVDDTKTGTDKSIIGATDLSLKLFITNADETAMAAIPISVYTAKRAGGSLDDSNARVSEVNTTAVGTDTQGSAVSPASNGKVYSVVLDDITTANMHFADINGDTTIDKLEKGVPFKPGEDITVYAVAYSNTTLCSIVYSNAITVNSLFADCHVDNAATNTPLTAYIANFRHLENLDGAVSGLRYKGADNSWGTVDVVAARQIEDLGAITTTESEGVAPTTAPTPTATPATTAAPGSGADAPEDLSWTGFVNAIKKANNTTTVQVYTLANTAATASADGKYRPVSPDYALTYNGGYDVVEGAKTVHKAHIITNVSASDTGAAGLFGAPTLALTVSDLVLYDFEISGDNAGTLAGTLPAGSSVTNVLAYHGEIKDATDKRGSVTGTGNAGGLVGSFAAGNDSDVSAVSQSAAAMLVSSTGTEATVSVGGLIGSAANVTVTDSYSGGHTVTGTGKYSTTEYNVTAASGNAGGLIGAASGTTSVNYCYSTCSASGTVAGSLIGAASGDAIAASYSYAVGKTSGNDAFLGSGSLSGLTITVFDHVHAVDMDNEDLMMLETLKTGEGADPTWKKRAETAPYDTALSEKKYPFPTVNQLHYIEATKIEITYSEPPTQPIQLTTHYGDWEEIKLLTDENLALINAERLSAKITMPRDQIVDGGVITMLIRGETSHPIIDATNDAYDKTKDAYLVLMVTKPASEDGEYTLSLSPDSVVPGVEAGKLQEWFAKLKKAGVGVQVPASDDAEIELNLDDITAPGSHFAQLFTTFIPGENISVAVKGGVVASDKLNAMVKSVMAHETLNSITKTVTTEVGGSSQSKTVTVAARTNSLFADPKRGAIVDGTDVSIATTASASIANFRHLENLDNAISGVNAATATLKFTQAKQIVDLSKDWTLPDGTMKNLSWPGFIAGIYNGGTYAAPVDNPEPIQVYRLADTDKQPTGDGCFLPVNVAGLTYDGGYTGTDGVLKAHSITGVRVNTDGNAGLFGTLESGSSGSTSSVSNLELIDFSITSTSGNAGALAGVSNGATIANVLAYNTTKADGEGHIGDAMTPTITAVSSAGGLVGNMTGGSVTQSAAALVVKSTSGSAGGLIGTMTGGTVTGSYSGGHTSGGAYTNDYNVIAVINAGGLIGAASGSVTVDFCYSTCSASGTTAGSLIGAAGENTVKVSHSYAVGKTSGTQTFLGSGSLLDRTGADYDFVYAVDMDNDDLLIPATKGDSDPDWKVRSGAVHYDSSLANQYIYPTVKQLYQIASAALPESQSAQFATHYGDWGKLPQLDVDLELINRERLSAKITLPAAQIADGGKITMLIHGDSTNAAAKDALLVFKVTKPATEGGTYTLSLSPESKVPDAAGTAIGSTDLATWFGKVKKTETGIEITGTGETAVAAIELNLDDITAAGRHFTNLFPQLTPGENITAAVKGGVIDQTKLETIAKGAETNWKVTNEGIEYVIAARTNSLFADPKTATYPDGTDLSASTGACVSIANFRHLENLDATISNLASSLSITKAVQIADLSDKAATETTSAELLSWTGFVSAVAKKNDAGVQQKIRVYKHTDAEDTTGTTWDDCFLPVNPAVIEYDGKGHTITGVVVNTAGNAGLFGTLTSKASNLELIDFSITSTGGNAGALAGVNSGASITNVLARNSAEKDNTTTPTVTAASSAGGLVGSMSDGSVTHCAAALVVNSTGGDAGGLIGKATGGTVSGSYSGGHTSGGAYSTTAFNVTATGSAGGLIGDAGSATVTNCYSTCSATGATAGGLVGTASGTLTNCYATGLVNGSTKQGAFAGSIGTASGCLYFEAVNPGMSAVGSGDGQNITEFDADLKTYHDFVGAGTTWSKANAYDSKLIKDYGQSFNLRTVSQIGTTVKQKDDVNSTLFVATHYGDWPMPGILVNNTKNGG